jgi:hypothetical protein
MSDINPKPVTEEEFYAVMSRVSLGMGHLAWKNVERAMKQLRKNGMPSANSYSLEHIDAKNEEDLNLKFQLVQASVFKAQLDYNGSTKLEPDFMILLFPLVREVPFVREFPAQVTVEE